MRNLFSILHRMVLVVGVLVALSPCSVCQQATPAMKTCSMTHMTGSMKCCHQSKPMSPLCKIMNQSTVTPASVHAPVVTTTVAAVRIFQPPVLLAVNLSVVVPSFDSPPRSSPVLRI